MQNEYSTVTGIFADPAVMLFIPALFLLLFLLFACFPAAAAFGCLPGTPDAGAQGESFAPEKSIIDFG